MILLNNSKRSWYQTVIGFPISLFFGCIPISSDELSDVGKVLSNVGKVNAGRGDCQMSQGKCRGERLSDVGKVNAGGGDCQMFAR